MSIKPNAGTASSVTSAAADTVILAANGNRKGATIYNESTAILYVLLAVGTASATNYSVQVTPNTSTTGYYEVPFGYTGIIKGIWASANGFARVTEIA